jgi:hypothetical protein
MARPLYLQHHERHLVHPVDNYCQTELYPAPVVQVLAFDRQVDGVSWSQSQADACAPLS